MRKFIKSSVYTCSIISSVAFADTYFTVDNDILAGTGKDRYYTSGIRLESEINAPVLKLSGLMEKLNKRPDEEKIYVVLGQDIYTPEGNPTEFEPNDRPYAGHLYGGLRWELYFDKYVDSIKKKAPYRSDVIEITGGVVGPSSLAEQVQNGVHALSGSQEEVGWEYQVRDSLAVQANYRHTERVLSDYKRYDLLLRGGGAIGTAQSYLEAGIEGRLNLFGGLTNYELGQRRRFLNTTQKGKGESNLKHFFKNLRADAFASADVKYMFNNIFIEGETLQNNHDVEMEDVVSEFRTGVVMTYKEKWDVSYVYVYRTEEFDKQESPQDFAGIIFRVGL